MPLVVDKDQPLVPALKVGPDGATRMIEMKAVRVQLDAFEIMGRAKIPYKELYERRYRALDRAKDRQ